MTKTRKKRPWNQKSRITSALRKIWLYSPQRRLAVAKIKAGGNICDICKEHFDKLDVDHVLPVVGLEGFTTWDNYIKRLMEGELRGLCTICHKATTRINAQLRRKFKKILTEEEN